MAFCYWHIKTRENSQGTDCSAHLHEGRCFKCPYENVDDRLTADYRCSDYRPLN